MARKLQSDKWLFLATLALLCVSVVMVYSASALVALERFQQASLFVTKQVMWAAVGVAVLSVVMRVDYRTYRNERVIWALLGVSAVLLVAVLFSRPVNGTRRWFAVGGFGIQPSELAKLAVIVTLARLMQDTAGTRPSWQSIVPRIAALASTQQVPALVRNNPSCLPLGVPACGTARCIAS